MDARIAEARAELVARGAGALRGGGRRQPRKCRPPVPTGPHSSPASGGISSKTSPPCIPTFPMSAVLEQVRVSVEASGAAVGQLRRAGRGRRRGPSHRPAGAAGHAAAGPRPNRRSPRTRPRAAIPHSRTFVAAARSAAVVLASAGATTRTTRGPRMAGAATAGQASARARAPSVPAARNPRWPSSGSGAPGWKRMACLVRLLLAEGATRVAKARGPPPSARRGPPM